MIEWKGLMQCVTQVLIFTVSLHSIQLNLAKQTLCAQLLIVKTFWKKIIKNELINKKSHWYVIKSTFLECFFLDKIKLYCLNNYEYYSVFY